MRWRVSRFESISDFPQYSHTGRPLLCRVVLMDCNARCRLSCHPPIHDAFPRPRISKQTHNHKGEYQGRPSGISTSRAVTSTLPIDVTFSSSPVSGFGEQETHVSPIQMKIGANHNLEIYLHELSSMNHCFFKNLLIRPDRFPAIVQR